MLFQESVIDKDIESKNKEIVGNTFDLDKFMDIIKRIIKKEVMKESNDCIDKINDTIISTIFFKHKKDTDFSEAIDKNLIKIDKEFEILTDSYKNNLAAITLFLEKLKENSSKYVTVTIYYYFLLKC